jgi:hypothetical protein
VLLYQHHGGAENQKFAELLRVPKQVTSVFDVLEGGFDRSLYRHRVAVISVTWNIIIVCLLSKSIELSPPAASRTRRFPLRGNRQ